MALYKDNKITEGLKLQLRIDFFNIFNRVNLGGVDANFADSNIGLNPNGNGQYIQLGNFGRSTSQLLPRWFDIAARFTF